MTPTRDSRLDGAGKLIPHNRCWKCGYISDSATDLEVAERGPKPGDIVLCMKCSAPSQYDDAMKLQAMSAAELFLYVSDLPPSGQRHFARVVNALRQFQEERKILQ
jgi:hypothetical protein